MRKVYGGHYPEHPKEDADGDYKQVGTRQSLIKHTLAFLNVTTCYLAVMNVI